MKELALSQGLATLLDDEDYELAQQWKWYAKRIPRYFKPSYHAMRTYKRPDGTVTTLTLHRVIMGAPPGLVVDHINHNTLDNRKENLRVVTQAENLRNAHPDSRFFKRRARTHVDTYFRGVSFRSDNPNKPYAARVYYKGSIYRLGVYATAEEASLMVEAKRQEFKISS